MANLPRGDASVEPGTLGELKLRLEGSERELATTRVHLVLAEGELAALPLVHVAIKLETQRPGPGRRVAP